MIAALALAAAVAVPPVPADYVTDKAHALSAGAADSIRRELRSYYDATGNRIIVYLAETTGDTPLEDWTVDAAEKWKIRTGKDKSAKDNAAVLFAFMQDRKVRIEVGYGLEPSLTDADSSRIIQETIVPKMRTGDVDGAIQSGVDRMVLTITPLFKEKIGHEVAQPSADDGTSTAIAFLIIALIFIALLVLFVGSLFNRRWRSAWYWGAGTGGWGGGGWSSGGGGGFSGGGIGGGFSGAGFGGGGASGSW
ncbi:MAG TPA: TPM domain-containing protein [Candidatus Baltobacteraceae bacterium]|nr:TPM domain-containing protein [Candidatus Baltobacteraceae bacterium]